MIRVLICFGCLLLAACTKSPVPITAPVESKAEEALLGKWQYKLETDEVPESVFIKRGDNGELIVAGEAPEGGTEAEDFHVIVARLDDQWYASVYVVVPPDEKPYPASYMLLRYELRDADHFALYGADGNLLMDAINRKVIAGAAYEDRHLPGIELSASSEDLRAFIKAHGARVFTAGPVEFTRVKQQAAPAEATPPRP